MVVVPRRNEEYRNFPGGVVEPGIRKMAARTVSWIDRPRFTEWTEIANKTRQR